LPLCHGPLALISLEAKRTRVLCRFRCLRAQPRGRPNRFYGKRGTRRHRQQATRRHAHSTAPQLARIECAWRSHFPGQARPGASAPSGSATSQPTAHAQGRSCIRQIWGAANTSHQKLQGLRLSLAAGLVDATEPGRLDGEPRLTVTGRRPYKPQCAGNRLTAQHGDGAVVVAVAGYGNPPTMGMGWRTGGRSVGPGVARRLYRTHPAGVPVWASRGCYGCLRNLAIPEARRSAPVSRIFSVLPQEQHEWTATANLSVIKRPGPRRRLPTCFSDGVRHGRHARKAGCFSARVYLCVVRRHLRCAHSCAPSTG
jgi:hypothetical protein